MSEMGMTPMMYNGGKGRKKNKKPASFCFDEPLRKQGRQKQALLFLAGEGPGQLVLPSLGAGEERRESMKAHLLLLCSHRQLPLPHIRLLVHLCCPSVSWLVPAHKQMSLPILVAAGSSEPTPPALYDIFSWSSKPWMLGQPGRSCRITVLGGPSMMQDDSGWCTYA